MRVATLTGVIGNNGWSNDPTTRVAFGAPLTIFSAFAPFPFPLPLPFSCGRFTATAGALMAGVDTPGPMESVEPLGKGPGRTYRRVGSAAEAIARSGPSLTCA